MENFSEFRMYEREFPLKGEKVVCLITEILDDGAYVELLEYGNKRGLIKYTEISRKGPAHWKKIVKRGKELVLVVILVDIQNNCIDLSRRLLKIDEIKEKEEYYNKSKIVHLIFKSLSLKVNKPIEYIFKEVGWKLYRNYNHALDGLLLFLNNEKLRSELVEESTLIDPLLEIVKNKLVSKSVKIRSEFELKCFTFNGIDDIKWSLTDLKYDKQYQFKFRLIASPVYQCNCESKNKQEAIAEMNEILKQIQIKINSKGGSFNLIKNPEVIGEQEEIETENELRKARNSLNDFVDDEYFEGIIADI